LLLITQYTNCRPERVCKNLFFIGRDQFHIALAIWVSAVISVLQSANDNAHKRNIL